MSSLYYTSDERKLSFIEEAYSWRGTPFFPHSKAKGQDGGVDCVHFCQEVHAACGLIARYPFPPYQIDWTQNQDRSVILEVLESNPEFSKKFEKIAAPEPAKLGDILCFRIGRNVGHIALALSESVFIHALQPLGVQINYLNDTFHGKNYFGERLTFIFRPVEI